MGAANVRFLKVTNTEAIVKIDGASGDSGVIALSGLVGTHEIFDDQTDQTVNINMMVVSGKPGGVVTVARSGVDLYNLSVDACAVIDLQALGPISDPTLNTQDINVTIGVAPSEVIIKLRKLGGYKTKHIETVMGVYTTPDA